MLTPVQRYVIQASTIGNIPNLSRNVPVTFVILAANKNRAGAGSTRTHPGCFFD